MIKQRFWYTCDVKGCAAVQGEEHEVFLGHGTRMPQYCLPYGWNVVDRRLICDKHKLTVEPKEQK